MADLYNYPEIYDERFGEMAYNAYKNHYQKMLAGKEIHTVLDCSVGTGNLTFCLGELGYQISGSDLSGSMLAQARKNAEKLGLQVSLTQCDFRELTRYFNQPFDCVMSTGNALAHVSPEDVQKTIREMDALVKPGGYLYLDSRNWDLEVKRKKHFEWAQPFIRQDGVRINCVQNWEHHPDGSITIHINNAYERDGRIFEINEFEEHLTPFSFEIVRTTLAELGYGEFTVKPLPWFEDKPFEEIKWYCVLAQKPQ